MLTNGRKNIRKFLDKQGQMNEWTNEYRNEENYIPLKYFVSRGYNNKEN